MTNVDNVFPPCPSAEFCNVDEEEKRRVSQSDHQPKNCAIREKCVNACAAYGKVCPCSARVAGHAACEAVQALKKDSRIFTAEQPDFTFLDTEDILIGEKLGEGGFSNVNQCIVTSGEEAGCEFAIKYLKRRAMVDLSTFKHGASDLAIEAWFLQTLHHPNIVQLHGVTAGSVETNVASGKECGFFIVVDRLFDTLEKRLEVWRAEHEAHPENFLTRRSTDYKEKKKTELMEKIRIALSIADAMEYLHSLNIVYRDLKPDNIGFDKDGVLKLFDFGLSKELKTEDASTDGKFALTGNTGSRRYMAPEVARDAPYDKSVDVYGFGILMWELCSAEKPFYGYSTGKHHKLIVLGGERPKMDAQHTANWPVNLQLLMKKCWSSDPSARPSFTDVKQILRDILLEKDAIPETLRRITEHEEAKEQAEEVPAGGFATLFRSPKLNRGKTTGIIATDSGGVAMPSPLSKQKRGRSWGGLLR